MAAPAMAYLRVGRYPLTKMKRKRTKVQDYLRPTSLLMRCFSRPREGADTTTSSNSKWSEGSKDFKAAEALRRKPEMQAWSSSGHDDVLQQKPNIWDRSIKYWWQFKSLEKGLKDDLEAY